MNDNSVKRWLALWPLAGALAAAGAAPESVFAQVPQANQSVQNGESTYADLADLANAATMVLRVKIRKQITLEPERSPGLKPGNVRLYIEAQTVSLLAGSSSIGESVTYLVDVPLGAKGRPPKLKKQEMLLFARSVVGRPEEVQLVGQGAQLVWTPVLEDRVRPILQALASPDAPPVVTGVREALSVPGNLVGESETQMFLSTLSGKPVSVTVIRRPLQAPMWGVSLSEIVDQAARPPQHGTLEWYRLACFLPQSLPPSANLSRDPASRAQANQDYAFMMSQLGLCPRNRSQG